MYCQIFTSGDRYHVTRATRTDIWSEEWHKNRGEFYNPVLVSCQVPSDLKPVKLSLNVKPCERNSKSFNLSGSAAPSEDDDDDDDAAATAASASNWNKKKLITVCVKPLNFDQDVSEHLIQWIEINRILGASSIDVYVKKVHPNVRKVLSWYKNESGGFVNVRPYENVEDFGRKDEISGEERLSEGNLTLLKDSQIFAVPFVSLRFTSRKKVRSDISKFHVSSSRQAQRKVGLKWRCKSVSLNGDSRD